MQGFPYWVDGGSLPHQPKIRSSPPKKTKIYSLRTKSQFPPLNKDFQPNKNVIFRCSHSLYHLCFNFILF